MYRASFIVLYYNHKMHNCIITVYITTICLCNLHCTCFDTLLSSSGSYNQCLVTHVLQIAAVGNNSL